MNRFEHDDDGFDGAEFLERVLENPDYFLLLIILGFFMAGGLFFIRSLAREIDDEPVTKRWWFLGFAVPLFILWLNGATFLITLVVGCLFACLWFWKTEEGCLGCHGKLPPQYCEKCMKDAGKSAQAARELLGFGTYDDLDDP